jgi:hypothetical protein
MLYGYARVEFADTKLAVSETRDEAFLIPLGDGALTVDWDGSTECDVDPAHLGTEPPAGRYEDLPDAAGKRKNYEKWTKEFSRWLGQTRQLDLLRHDRLGIASHPGESERDFRVRLQLAAHEQRDRATDRLREKYTPKINALADRIRRAEQAVQRESEQASQEKVNTAVSFGATILGALLGRKAVSASTLGRATTAARGASRVSRQAQDVQRAQENVAALKAELADLESRVQAEADAVAGSFDVGTDTLTRIVVKPRRGHVSVQVLALAWVPRQDQP